MSQTDYPPGVFWHVHHNTLLEYCCNYLRRCNEILKKPPKEIKIRVRLFQPVRGFLPESLIRALKAYSETWEVLRRLGKVRNQAEDAYDWARDVDHGTFPAYCAAMNNYHEAQEAYESAWRSYAEARNAYKKAVIDHLPIIESLHVQECPDCPWDGENIFPAA